MLNNKNFLYYFILSSLANGIPIVFNKFIMQQLGVADYVKYQALWSVVLWFQPIVCLGSQNVIRVKEDHENIFKYIINSYLIAMPVSTIAIIYGVNWISILCSLVVVYISFVICYLESSKQLTKSAIIKLIWIGSCGVITILVISFLGVHSRLISTIGVGVILLLITRRNLPKLKNKVKFRRKIYTSYGFGLSVYVASINYIFFLDREFTTQFYTGEEQYQYACGFYLMNLVLFVGKPILLLAEIGVKSQKLWSINKSYLSTFLALLFCIVVVITKGLWMDLLFYSEQNYIIYQSTLILWLLIGVFRLFSDFLVPLMHEKRFYFYLVSILYLLGYLLIRNNNNEYFEYYNILFFLFVVITILHDFYTKQRSTCF